MEMLMNPEIWVALMTLTVLEIVLGIDNLVFISIITARLPEEERAKARKLGLMAALVSRLVFLAFASWLANLTQPLFTILDQGFSGRDIVLFLGGAFLIYKATVEVHEEMEGFGDEDDHSVKRVTLSGVIMQFMVLDIVFSIDSVITAVGLVNELWIMSTAIIIAMIVMVLAVNTISRFLEEHPTVKMLALAFLILVGVALIADAFGYHFPRGYLYFGMGFSAFVEILNMAVRTKAKKSEVLADGSEEG